MECLYMIKNKELISFKIIRGTRFVEVCGHTDMNIISTSAYQNLLFSGDLQLIGEV